MRTVLSSCGPSLVAHQKGKDCSQSRTSKEVTTHSLRYSIPLLDMCSRCPRLVVKHYLDVHCSSLSSSRELGQQVFTLIEDKDAQCGSNPFPEAAQSLAGTTRCTRGDMGHPVNTVLVEGIIQNSSYG